MNSACPDVGVSRPPTRCMSVDLPEPDGPMIETNSPAAIDRLTPRTALTVRRALLVDLGNVDEFHHGRSLSVISCQCSVSVGEWSIRRLRWSLADG